MRVDRDELPSHGVELASAWLDRWREGDRATLDWLTTRTFVGELSGDGSGCPLDRARFVEYAGALSRGLDWRLDADRIEQREHVVRYDARLHAVHDGVLDLRPFDEARYAPTGRRLELPRQRFTWDVVHGRIHRFEVTQGPGLDPSTIVDRLDLGEEDRLGAGETGLDLGTDPGLADAGNALVSGNGQAGPERRGRPQPAQVAAWNGTGTGSKPSSPSPDRSADDRPDPESRTEPIGRRVDRLVERHRRRRRREQVWNLADGAES